MGDADRIGEGSARKPLEPCWRFGHRTFFEPSCLWYDDVDLGFCRGKQWPSQETIQELPDTNNVGSGLYSQVLNVHKEPGEGAGLAWA